MVVGAAAIPDNLFHQLKLWHLQEPLHRMDERHVLAARLVVVDEDAVVFQHLLAPLQESNLLILVGVFGKVVGVAGDAAVALGIKLAMLALAVDAWALGADVVRGRSEDQVNAAVVAGRDGRKRTAKQF